MPSNEALRKQAEDLKTQGNAAFGKSNVAEALSLYSQALAACHRLTDNDTASTTLQITLYSNRAMCHLKSLTTLDDCRDDCTAGLKLLESSTATGRSDDAAVKLRNKLLFRRAKAQFLSFNLPTNSQTDDNDGPLQEAAKDLLLVLQTDPTNKDATQLLASVRAQHKTRQATAATPVAKCLQALRSSSDSKVPQVKRLLGLLDHDLKNAALELGRLDGVALLLQQVRDGSDHDNKLVPLSLQCLSQAASHPVFVRQFLVSQQSVLLSLLQVQQSKSLATNATVLLLALWVRIILHADRDDAHQDVSGATQIDYPTLVETILTCLRRATAEGLESSQTNTLVRAVMDVVSTWTAGTDRERMIRHALPAGITDLAAPKTEAEIRAFTPQELAVHRRRQADLKDRDGAWAFERCTLICSAQDESNILQQLLHATCHVQDHGVRRELIVTVGRILAVLEDEDRIKGVVKPYLQNEGDDDEGVKIEEVFDEEEKMAALEEEVVTLEQRMQRAILTSALLLSNKEVGSWALATGWKTSSDDLTVLASQAEQPACQCLAAEVVSAAATVEAARHLVASLVSSGVMQTLLTSNDRDIRSGAASAVAKLGLSNKELQKDEAEVMGMLQAACDLLEDNDATATTEETKKDEAASSYRHFSSFATSSVERAVEMISYLISNTLVKEELAAGFAPHPGSERTALEHLVATAQVPHAGESLTGFALATIFQNMAVTNLQVRKEGFEGREVTMEQYDEMQKLGKTPEEQEVLDSQQDPDTTAMCHERVRKMAAANVPRAMVTLLESSSGTGGSPSEPTVQQLVQGWNRMATEESVRGIMIQQGVLSACLKLEKEGGPTETKTMQQIVQLARHVMAKLLVTTNPTLLTAAQRLGTMRPLVQLVRDHTSSDLAKFEALLSLTNLAGSGEDAQTRLVSERGIPSLHFAMFSEHEMVRRAATEALSNFVPHPAMLKHLQVEENLKLWLAFATDLEDHYECARAAAGCLAMATAQDVQICETLTKLEKFRPHVETLLECGRLEIMHRAFVLVLHLVAQGGDSRKRTIEAGLVVFCEAYMAKDQQDSTEALDFSPQERALLPVTVDLAQQIVQLAAAAEEEEPGE